MLVPLDQIEVSGRIREDYGSETEWRLFVASFTKYGQLQPLKVVSIAEPANGKHYELVAGDRRFKAIAQLNAESIPIPGLEPGFIEISFRDPAPLHTKLMMEFAENNDRKDFNFIERAKFIRKFHEMMILVHKDTWTQELTAHSLNLSPASISHYLRVEEAVKTNSGVAKAKSLQAAVKRMKVDERIKERKKKVEDDGNRGIERATQLLHRGDAQDWIKQIGSGTIDLVNFDPPWGDNTSYKAAENHESFEDDTESAEALMQNLLPEIFRVLKDDRFCIFWFRACSVERLAKFAEDAGFNLQFTRTPCIWYKPDKTTDQNRVPEKQLIEAYEMFYLLRKGDPIFYEKFTHNVFAFERVKLGSIIHPTEKPLDLNTALLKLCSVPGETVLDPTAGSASFLDAAIRSSRRVLGCELSERYHERGVVRLAEQLKNFSEKK